MVFFKKRKIKNLQAKDDARGLITMICREKNREIAQMAVRSLAQLTSERSMAVLAEALEDEHQCIREAAVRGLMFSRHEQVLPMLTRALNDEHVRIRRLVAVALGNTGSTQAVQSLLDIIRYPTADEYVQALDALVQIGRELDIKEKHSMIFLPLGEMLYETHLQKSDQGRETLEWMGWQMDGVSPLLSAEERAQQNTSRRVAILQTLEDLGWQPDGSAIEAEYRVSRGEWEACVRIGEPAVDLLIALLQDADEVVRQHAYNTLVEIGAPASAKLLNALQDDIADMRQSAFRALAKLGPSAISQIIASLKDEYADIRLIAIQELSNIGDPIAIGPIIEAAADIDPAVRLASQDALLRFGKQAIPPLLSAVRYSANYEIRWSAASVLDAMGWQPANDEAGAAYWIAKNEWDACVQIGQPAIKPLLEQLDHWDRSVREQAIKVMLRLGRAAVDQLIVVLRQISVHVRMDSITIIESLIETHLTCEQAEYILKALLVDTDEEEEEEEEKEMVQYVVKVLERLSKRKQKKTRGKRVRGMMENGEWKKEQADVQALPVQGVKRGP
jgi:HEAT repeat protein